VTPVRERDAIAALIDRIVAGARVPGRTEREDLRRELSTHFEDAGSSPEAIREAMDRFGAEASIAEALRHVYRWDYAAWYLVKIAASIVASVAAALVIQVAVNLRVELQAEAWRLAPGFSRGAGLSVAVVLGLITVWEAARPPFNRSRAAAAIGAYAVVCLVVWLVFANGIGAFITATMLVVVGYVCSKRERRPSRLLALFGIFAAALYVNHRGVSVAFGPSRALLASAVLVAVWSSTVVILNRVDRAFVSLFAPPRQDTA
jgi:hypothetical protein